MSEVGEMLTNVVVELKKFNVDEEEKGLFSFFKRSGNKISTYKAKYASAEANVNRICNVLEDHQVQLMKDIAMLDKMYDMNKLYFKELSMYILAGKKKLAEVRATELPALVELACLFGTSVDALIGYQAQDYALPVSLRRLRALRDARSFAEGEQALGGLVADCPELSRRVDLSFDSALEDLEGRFAETTGFSMEM